VVVNDGGARVDMSDVTLIQHEESRGRSEAANAGARAASNAFVAFLDDDDLFYPEHLETLAAAAQSSHVARYTDAISAFLRPGEQGAYETHSRMRLFAQDFDRELLLVDNYIPLTTLLLPRETFLDLGGFDPAFDLFEDWDFLIRLSARGDFLRIPRITCEVRHFEQGSSIVLAAPEGSDRFRAAKLQVWQKHAALLGNDVFANVFERQKQRMGALFSDLVTTKGQIDGAQIENARLDREKHELIRQGADTNNLINGYALRVRELEGSLSALNDLVIDYTEKVMECERVVRENDALRATNHASHVELERLRVEIQRLNGLLDMIYSSRTWKLHTMLERLRGRA
jgi:glycosyltransferase involved in cell wall biosynthesis